MKNKIDENEKWHKNEIKWIYRGKIWFIHDPIKTSERESLQNLQNSQR